VVSCFPSHSDYLFCFSKSQKSPDAATPFWLFAERHCDVMRSGRLLPFLHLQVVHLPEKTLIFCESWTPGKIARKIISQNGSPSREHRVSVCDRIFFVPGFFLFKMCPGFVYFSHTCRLRASSSRAALQSRLTGKWVGSSPPKKERNIDGMINWCSFCYNKQTCVPRFNLGPCPMFHCRWNIFWGIWRSSATKIGGFGDIFYLAIKNPKS